MTKNKIDAAIGYARHGWAVFALREGSKEPLVGSRGVKDATRDESETRERWLDYRDANIGLACGNPSGVWVVDVDVKNGVDGLRSLAEAGITLPPTLTASTPSGGKHYLYKVSEGNEPPRNKNGLLNGVDIRGSGYYIVVAPSSVTYKDKDGKTISGEYSWDNWGAELAEFPDELKPQNRQPQPAREIVTAPVTITQDHSAIIERARAYLAQCDAAISGAGGHNATIHAAHALVVGFGLSDGDALALLLDEYNPRCQPPWSEKDLRHKVKSARGKPQRPSGYLLSDAPDFQPSDALDEAGNAIAEAMLAADASDHEDEDTATISETNAVPDNGVLSLPPELLRPAGLVGDIADYINATSQVYQPLFAIGAAFAVCGALMGRKVRTDGNLRTNLYILLVGGSGSGKTCVLSLGQSVLDAAKAGSMLCGEVTSEAALESLLSRSPSVFLGLDEVGHFFASAKREGKSGGAAGTIPKALLKLYSAAGSIYLGKQYADRQGVPMERKRIDQPNVCILGTAPTKSLYRDMEREELENGFYPRFLVFPPLDAQEKRSVPFVEVPPAIANACAQWLAFRPNAPEGTGDLAATLVNHPLVIPMEPDAAAELQTFRTWADQQCTDGIRNEAVGAELWTRAAENAERLALVLACGREEAGHGATIGVSDVRYAVGLVRFLVTRMLADIGANVAENYADREKKRLLSIIRASGSAGIGQRDLTRRAQFIRDQRTRQSYIEDLSAGGFIRSTKVGTRVTYYAK